MLEENKTNCTLENMKTVLVHSLSAVQYPLVNESEVSDLGLVSTCTCVYVYTIVGNLSDSPHLLRPTCKHICCSKYPSFCTFHPLKSGHLTTHYSIDSVCTYTM